MPSISFGYVPDGFVRTDVSSSQANNTIIYQNQEGEFIKLDYTNLSHAIYIDNEHYRTSDVQINGSSATFWESQDPGFANILVWNSADTNFILRSILPEDEVIKIAENLQ